MRCTCKHVDKPALNAIAMPLPLHSALFLFLSLSLMDRACYQYPELIINAWSMCQAKLMDLLRSQQLLIQQLARSGGDLKGSGSQSSKDDFAGLAARPHLPTGGEVASKVTCLQHDYITVIMVVLFYLQ